jgi:hypothetical protein
VTPSRKPVPEAYIKRWKHESRFAGGDVPVPLGFLTLAARLDRKLTPTEAMLIVHVVSFK